MGKKVILFDLGDVVEWHQYQGLYRYIAQQCNCSPVRAEEIFLEKVRLTDTRALAVTRLIPTIEKELACSLNKREFVKRLYNGVKEDHPVFSLLKELRKDYTLVLFSNLNEQHAKWSIKKWNLKRYFGHLFFSYQYKTRKPEVKFYKIVLKKLQINPEECIMIDDKEQNLKPARKLGMKTILFKGNVKEVKKKIEMRQPGFEPGS